MIAPAQFPLLGLRVPQWIDEDDARGNPCPPIKLADLGTGWKILFYYQHWCLGCHSHGFPTLQKLVEALSGQGVGFVVVQTVFEGHASNTLSRLREAQLRYGLKILFGHESATGAFPV